LGIDTTTLHTEEKEYKAMAKKNTLKDKVRTLCGAVGLNLSDLVRRHNNSVIKAYDGEFEYGTNKGEFYGEFETHEAYVCGVPALLKARTAKVLASLKVWVDEGHITKAQEKQVVLHLRELGKIS